MSSHTNQCQWNILASLWDNKLNYRIPAGKVYVANEMHVNQYQRLVSARLNPTESFLEYSFSSIYEVIFYAPII